MKLFSINKLVLFVSSLLSSVSCYITAECITGKQVVLKKFTTDTTELFKKLAEIKSCGEMYAKPRFHSSFEYIEYRKCISNLLIPESYEKNISSFYDYNFNNGNRFRYAIKFAARKVCSDIENSHVHEVDDIKRKIYKVYGKCPYEDIKKFSKSFRDNRTAYNGSSKTILFIVGGVLIMIILMFSIYFIFIRINGNTNHDEPLSKIHIKKDIDMYHDTQPTADKHPVTLNEADPPPYHEVKSEYYNVPLTNLKNLPYSVKEQ